MIAHILLISLFWGSPAGPAAGGVDAARAAFDAGNYSAAVTALNPAFTATPEDASAHYWALRSYYELRDYENAVNHGEKAVRLEPQNSEYNRWLGRAYGAKAEQTRSFFLARKVKQ